MNNQLNNEEAKKYWKEHSKIWKHLDRNKDKAGLSNVCHPGAPLWYNKFFAYWQRTNINRMVRKIPSNNKKALEIGCGTGRWCKLLSEQGFKVTGIDIQSETIQQNKRLIGECNFYEMSADELGLEDNAFDLVLSITVLQHMPYTTQEKIFKEIYRVLKVNGRLLLLENTKDKAPHVFSRPFEEWKMALESQGFELVDSTGQGYVPLLRLFDGLVLSAINSLRASSEQGSKLSGSKHARKMLKKSTLRRKLYYSVKFPILMVSYLLEYICNYVCPNNWATHGVYLFRKQQKVGGRGRLS